MHDRTGEQVGRVVAEHQIVISELTPVGSSLEEIFFELTGELRGACEAAGRADEAPDRRRVPEAAHDADRLALIGSVVGLVVLISLLATFTSDPDTEDFDATDLLGISGFAQIVRAGAGHPRRDHGVPPRHDHADADRRAQPRRLVLAKLIANVAAGLVLGLLAVGLCAVIVLLGLSARDIETGLDSGEIMRIVVGQTLATGLWAALGVGLGALVRNQVGAIVGALIWTFLGENLLTIIPAVGDAVQKYGLNGASNALGNLETENTGDVLVPGSRRAAAGRLRRGLRGRRHPRAPRARRHQLERDFRAAVRVRITHGPDRLRPRVLACLLAPHRRAGGRRRGDEARR